MEYIKSNNRKKYGREYVSIMIKKKKIINNPGMKLDDEYQKFRTATLAVIFVFLIFLVITKASSNIICAFLSGMIFFELVIGCIRLIGMKKAMKPLQNKKEPHFDFDEEGLIISRVEEKLKVKVYWENYQCIRVYKYSIAFLPNSEDGTMMIFPIENYENIMAFLEEHNIEMQVIKK